jgi:hypothetical protein
VAIEPGDFLGGSDAADVVADLTTPGEVVLGASRRADRAPVAGRGRLALVTLRALADGDAELVIRAHRVMTASLAPVAGVETRRAEIEVREALDEEP